MDRNKRYTNRVKRVAKSSSNGYIKRENTAERKTHYILYPVVLSTINKSNDFFFHTLKLCWNDKNIVKDRRVRQMFSGFHLENGFDTRDLAISAESRWFCSSRQNDLVKIGKIAGYFIRKCAYSVGQALYDEFDVKSYSPVPDEKFNNFVDNLKSSKAIVPVVVKLQISPESSFNVDQFICLGEDLVRNLIDGDEEVVTCRATIIKIKSRLHDWAWTLLNIRLIEDRVQALNDGIPYNVPDNILEISDPVFAEDTPSSLSEGTQEQKRIASSRIKYANKKYSSDIYDTN